MEVCQGEDWPAPYQAVSRLNRLQVFRAVSLAWPSQAGLGSPRQFAPSQSLQTPTPQPPFPPLDHSFVLDKAAVATYRGQQKLGATAAGRLGVVGPAKQREPERKLQWDNLPSSNLVYGVASMMDAGLSSRARAKHGHFQEPGDCQALPRWNGKGELGWKSAVGLPLPIFCWAASQRRDWGSLSREVSTGIFRRDTKESPSCGSSSFPCRQASKASPFLAGSAWQDMRRYSAAAAPVEQIHCE